VTPLEGGQGFGDRIGDLRRERQGSRSGKRAGELGEDRQVGV
jgi:hypothetical protein